jgi:hypothetical protein
MDHTAAGKATHLGRWMHSVRQIIALFREGFAQWHLLARNYLTRCHLINLLGDASLPNKQLMEMVERVIDMLVRAMYCRLHCFANYGDEDRGEFAQDHNTIRIRPGKPEVSRSCML